MAMVAAVMWSLAGVVMFLTALSAVGLYGSAIVVAKIMDHFNYVRR